MSKVLYVGDPHIRPDCLDEGQRLVNYICKVAREEGADYICLLGDLFHTHSVIHMSVLAFWKWGFKELAAAAPTYALVGNHDMSGKVGDAHHSMMLYDPKHVTVIQQPTILPWDALGVPYIAEQSWFLDTVNLYANQGHRKLLVCHQTFDGSQYENGFYAKDGIDPNLVPQERVISGHIHTPQHVGKVWYPGSPRWQTVSDANTRRYIYLVDHAKDTVKGHPTEEVCRPIYCLTDKIDAQAVLPEVEADVIVDVFGDEQYVRGRAEELTARGFRVRQFPTTTKQLKVKESDGLPTSFKKFMGEHVPKFGTPKERLMELAQSRISWLKA